MQFLCYVTFSNANSQISFFCETSNGRLPLEQSSDLCEFNFGQTRFRQFAKFHFSTPEKFWKTNCTKNLEVEFYFWKSGVLEEPWIFNPRWHVRRKKLLPEVPLFLERLPWRRGKWPNICRNLRLGTENDFNHLGLWWCEKSSRGRFFFFNKVGFWRSYEGESITGMSVVKSYCL